MDRYRDIPLTRSTTGKTHYSTTKYPEIPLDSRDTYVYSAVGDRFDLLANQYYKDSTLWWVISIANPNLTQDSYFIPEGSQIRIPTNISGILAQYNTLNTI